MPATATAQVSVLLVDAPAGGEAVSRKVQRLAETLAVQVSSLPVAPAAPFARPSRRCADACVRALVEQAGTELVVALDVRAVDARAEKATVDVQLWQDAERRGTRTVEGSLTALEGELRSTLEALLPPWARAGFGGVVLDVDPAATVKVDGRRVAGSGAVIPLPSGRHGVDAVFPGGAAVLERVLVEEGRRTRLALQRPPATPAAPVRRSGALMALSYATWMVGAATLAAGLVAGALSRWTGAGLVPCSLDVRACAPLEDVLARNRQAQAYATTGNVLLATGGGLLAVGLSLFIIDVALR